MITDFNMYENISISKIYKVPTKMPDFEIAKKRIGAEEFQSHFDEYSSVLLHCDDGHWTWSSVDSTAQFGGKYIDSVDYKGEIVVTQEDIDDYHTEKEMKKYNL